MCGYCASVCPEGVNIGALLRVSRAERMNAGSYPEALHDFWMREMEFSAGEASLCAPPPGKTECGYVFFPGCQLGASNPEHVRGSYRLLNADGDCGVYLGCCGAPAWWAGDDKRFFENFSAIRAGWRAMGKPVFVFACATCAGLFAAFAPEITGVSLYERLAGRDDLAPADPFGRASVFDPCSARGSAGMQTAVRAILERAGVEMTQLPEKNRCCGYGGHMRAANPKLYDEIARNRASLGGDPYIVYCANCREVFASYGKECAHILDVALGLDPAKRTPGISEKRRNALALKGEFMMDNLGERFARERPAWDTLTLVMDDALRARLDRELISEDDIKETIHAAQSDGAYFVDAADGARVCGRSGPVLTYWARYRSVADGAYEVLDAYCHRMRFEI
jgi:hypothetical protein